MLQHEDGQAWAESEGEVPEPLLANKGLLDGACSCSISDGAGTDTTIGATDITDVSLARSIIADCSVIVGIHPDQVRHTCSALVLPVHLQNMCIFKRLLRHLMWAPVCIPSAGIEAILHVRAV